MTAESPESISPGKPGNKGKNTIILKFYFLLYARYIRSTIASRPLCFIPIKNWFYI